MKKIIVCLFFLCAVATTLWGRFRVGESKEVRLVAYNVGVFSKYGDDTMPEIAGMMHELGADAVAVCEQDSCNRRHASFQTRNFAEVLGPEWDYRYASAMQWNGGSYGGGVVTDRRINRSFIVELPQCGGYEPRVCVAVETKDYVVAEVHLDHSNDAVRMEQVRLLTDELKRQYGRSRKPVFLCGDLNTLPGGPVIRQLCEDWTVLSEPAPTYPSQNPHSCIDYILALNNHARYEVLGTAVCTEFETADVRETSDHLPVYVDVRIR